MSSVVQMAAPISPTPAGACHRKNGTAIPQRFFRVAPDDTLAIATADCEYPNGLAFSPDERTLYVANTRTRMFIHAFDVQADGGLTSQRFFASMSSPIVPRSGL